MRQSKRRRVEDPQENNQSAKLSFEAALDAYLSAQDAAGHSKVSRDDYRRVVGQFLFYMADTHHYTHVQGTSERDLLAWMAYLRMTDNKLGRP